VDLDPATIKKFHVLKSWMARFKGVDASPEFYFMESPNMIPICSNFFKTFCSFAIFLLLVIKNPG
jgi:hypothetical protein